MENCAAEVFDRGEVVNTNTKGFPLSPIILAVCSPYQEDIGNNLILQLLLEHDIGGIDINDSQGINDPMRDVFLHMHMIDMKLSFKCV